MGRIKAIITDFDGTIVDTFMPNYLAYKSAFNSIGYELNLNTYKKYYGLRFDDLCKSLGIDDNETRNKIKNLKASIYPNYFEYARLNENLIRFIISCKSMGMRTCIASTASKINLYGVLNYFKINSYFDIIITGDDVNKGKPNPEVYLKAMNLLECDPEEVIIFEDSETGCEAAEAAEVQYIKITNFINKFDND